MGRRRRVIWTEPAEIQLSSAAEFFAQRSPHAADRLLRAVDDAALSLGALSHRGRHAPEFPGTGVREIFVRRFRLMYRIDGETVLIVAIIHSARDVTSR